MTIPKRYLLLATVFLTGCAVLIFEVTAVRMLTPHFGSSLYVLSSVLTVILAALSGGYYIGGKIADRMPYSAPLMTIIATAGVMMVALFHSSQYFLPVSTHIFGAMSGPLICSLVFFFIPALLLGIDSPFVIKLLTTDTATNETGETVGLTFFWSTVGSITGSLIAGFYLLPFWGVTATITATSLIIIAWATAVHLLLLPTLPVDTPPNIVRLSKKTTYYLLIIGAIAILISYNNLSHTKLTATTLYQADGFYSHLQIFDLPVGTSTYRFLKNDSNYSSAIKVGNAELTFPYAQLANLYRDMNVTPKNYLVLGSGTYTIPRFLLHDLPTTTIDVVEIESRLLPLSHTYFELPHSPNLHSHFVDARVFLQSTTTTYDVIFSDVMNGGHVVPQHLATTEFFTALRSRLSSDGIAIVNFIGALNLEGPNLADSMRATIASVFPNYAIVAVTGPDTRTRQNIMFVLRHEGKPITFDSTRTLTNHFLSTSTPLSQHIVTTPLPAPETQFIFTDDRAPIEPLMVTQEINEEKPR